MKISSFQSICTKVEPDHFVYLTFMLHFRLHFRLDSLRDLIPHNYHLLCSDHTLLSLPVKQMVLASLTPPLLQTSIYLFSIWTVTSSDKISKTEGERVMRVKTTITCLVILVIVIFSNKTIITPSIRPLKNSSG